MEKQKEIECSPWFLCTMTHNLGYTHIYIYYVLKLETAMEKSKRNNGGINTAGD